MEMEERAVEDDGNYVVVVFAVPSAVDVVVVVSAPVVSAAGESCCTKIDMLFLESDWLHSFAL